MFGFIFNDIIDRNIDKKVKRTKSRPISAGRITVKKSLAYVFILCLSKMFHHPDLISSKIFSDCLAYELNGTSVLMSLELRQSLSILKD